jgi:hypothetical protein
MKPPKLLFAALTPEQIQLAKARHGGRKQITHAVLCGPFGQLFGTRKHCEKYYSAWRDIFANLFDGSEETTTAEIADYATTFNLVNVLFAAQNANVPRANATELDGVFDIPSSARRGAADRVGSHVPTNAPPPGLFARLWRRLTSG